MATIAEAYVEAAESQNRHADNRGSTGSAVKGQHACLFVIPTFGQFMQIINFHQSAVTGITDPKTMTFISQILKNVNHGYKCIYFMQYIYECIHQSYMACWQISVLVQII